MRKRAARPRIVLTNSKFASYNEPTILPYNCDVDIVKCRRYKAGDIVAEGGGIVVHLAVELYAKRNWAYTRYTWYTWPAYADALDAVHRDYECTCRQADKLMEGQCR